MKIDEEATERLGIKVMRKVESEENKKEEKKSKKDEEKETKTSLRDEE